ncbi:hypothetical protein [Gordonia terrae]|uniref:Uncharacterized protein n=2 Tax=Gordonia terrae TaxID=2055 RepID=A0AAD0P0Z5_9ACTN|nr:hypothetical protein [Gordonia terrae]VTR08191.1 Uncharacterised protein [Clostridioides difficile]ANY25297.1 hypothetical protein BCM27_23025 [Gordonia terrae]AWO86049.1 hypothetical protein DLJ61_23275 [Gordonia terrae]VTS62635.1 Uncharacterised protein [Gordonia terrae]GAB46855.1 hypothetical protein GOTRE_182_00330 [Gordonia terrae NBRC 100016]
MTPRRLLPALYGTSIGATAVILAPLLPGLIGIGDRYLLYRDAVSTPRTHVTDTTLGIGDLPPRAVPQDWFLAMASTVVDGGIVVLAVLAAALVFAGVGYGRLAARLVPDAGRTGAAAAALVAIWNPYVAERLLQGHWSLLAGFAALGWIVVTVLDLRERPPQCEPAPSAARRDTPLVEPAPSEAAGSSKRRRSASRSRSRVEATRRPDPRAHTVRLLQLGGLFAVAGLTPTGSVLAGIVFATALLARPIGLRPTAVAVALWVLSALPWLLTSLITDAPTTSAAAGVEAFGLRSEPWLGPVGTVGSLGGIWNADAVPASRTIGWAAVATICLLLVVAVGAGHLWRRRRQLDPLVRAIAVLASVTAILLLLSTFGPVRAGLGFVVEHVGGGGLLRDTQKFSALLVPAVAVCVAAAVAAARRRVPSGFAFAAVALLVVAPLPDLAWGVGGAVRAIDYPDEWRQVADIVPPARGSVALWPPGTVREYPFARDPSLDPAARTFRAPVVESGELRVDGEVIDPAGEHAAAVTRVLESGGSPAALAALGVGWVAVENDDPPAQLAASGHMVFDGPSLRLYQVTGPADRSADDADRAIATGAHLAWAALLVAGLISAGVGVARTTRRRTSP